MMNRSNDGADCGIGAVSGQDGRRLNEIAAEERL
jgi:hypothetical protein